MNPVHQIFLKDQNLTSYSNNTKSPPLGQADQKKKEPLTPNRTPTAIGHTQTSNPIPSGNIIETNAHTQFNQFQSDWVDIWSSFSNCLPTIKNSQMIDFTSDKSLRENVVPIFCHRLESQPPHGRRSIC